MRLSAISALALALAAFCCARADPDTAADGAGSAAPAAPAGAIARLAGTLREAGWWNHLREPGAWERRRATGPGRIEDWCARYGWNSPADRFWIDAVEEVQAVPPWDLQGRFDTFVGALGDRYELDEKQRGALSDLIVREGARVFSRHGVQLLQIGLAARQAWASGEPITAEQVAEWAESADPIFQDVREQIDAAVGKFTQVLEPAQREAVARDFGVVSRRLDALHEVEQGWARGQWSPRDWGLTSAARPAQSDTGAVDAAMPGPAAGGADLGPAPKVPVSAPARAGDDDPWAVYVRTFIQRFALDEAQQQRAWIAYRDAQDMADRVCKRYASQAEYLQGSGQSTGGGALSAARDGAAARRKAALDRLFEQLKTRLDRLPTRAQRRIGGEVGTALQPTTRPSTP